MVWYGTVWHPRAQLISVVPWNHYQALVDLFMVWLTQVLQELILYHPVTPCTMYIL